MKLLTDRFGNDDPARTVNGSFHTIMVAAVPLQGNGGGISVQEGYLDHVGRAVTKHTVYDSDGHIIHGPHFRPGGFK